MTAPARAGLSTDIRLQVFASRAQANEAAMLHHLEDCALLHPLRGGFALVWFSPHTTCMQGLAQAGMAVLLEDW